MARTIAEIQNEILEQKKDTISLNKLNNESKTSIWKLWINIVATAIWIHEKIVERNALISRPHTLNWYREQALNYIHGQNLIWKDGSYQFETNPDSLKSDIELQKIIKHCAVSEVELEALIGKNNTQLFGNSSHLYNNIGVVHMKVATDMGENIKPISNDQLSNLKEYISRIKDAGNQIIIESLPGDILSLTLDVYVDPLVINVSDEDKIQNDNTTTENTPKDPKIGTLINSNKKPVEDAIRNYLKNLDFNGAFVKTFLIDAIQKAEGVKIPILIEASSKVNKTVNTSENDSFKIIKEDFVIPKAGYFDLEDLKMNITYKPYTFYREYESK
ncbi:hypothetical protein [Flavobacterium oreochromis]|uniref:Nucleotidyltransferase n=2 Tax=Flavobacterium TaxID=237 RepID=A0A2D0AHM7_9FLAO|nr:hypothetical protein [Flavobacterium oreochromis]OWP75678.1 hypothetical protein BWK62_11460 [Flavobacterium oreochromis]OWP78317.1 hypothetical protein BWG23_02255 [Flavobacterium oreochromis]